MSKESMKNQLKKGFNAAAAYVGIAQTPPQPTIFVALGQLNGKKLTKIRVVAERGELDNSSSRLNKETAFDLRALNDPKNTDTQPGMYENNYTIYKADSAQEIEEAKNTIINRIKKPLLSLFRGSSSGVGTGTNQGSLANAKNPTKKPYNPRSIKGGSKKTQRRRQKSQNRKSRRI